MNLHFLRVRSHRSSRRRQPLSLTIIPQEIVDTLFSCLSTIDQICLALTCKSFYHYFHSFLRKRDIKELSQLFPAERRKQKSLYRNMDLQNQPMIRLLLQLENKRWKYCSECWRLHRRSAWRLPLHDPSYTNKRVLSSRPMKSCMAYAGTQNICPCLTITYPDKVRLIELLESIRNQDTTTRTDDENRVLYHPVSRFPTCIGHNCYLTGQHPLADINATTILDWDEEKDRLRVRSQYTFRDSAHFKEMLQKNIKPSSQVQWVPSGFQTTLMCPHKRPRRWLEQFFKESNTGLLNFSFLYTRVGLYTRDCQCGEVKTEVRPYDGLSIYVEQDLGGISWLGKPKTRDLDRFLHELSIVLSSLSVALGSIAIAA